MPLKLNVTANAVVVSPVRVSVNVPVLPASDAFGSVDTMVTVGGTLSAIVTVALLGEPITYFVLAAIVAITDSGPSVAASAIGVTATVAEVCPARSFLVTLIEL